MHLPARRLAVVAGLLLLTVAFYWKLSLTDQYEWMTGEDLATQVLAWFRTEAELVHKGVFPLWDPYLWNGQPLAAQAQPGAFYPLNWALFLSPMHDGSLQFRYLRFYRLAIHFLALLLCYRLCRDLGLSRLASTLGGAAFSFDGFIGTSGWPQWINGATWTPAVFLFQLRVLRGERPIRNAALSGAALGVAFLSGHHQVPLFLAIVATGVWLWSRKWACAAVAALFTLLISAAQMVPAIEFGRASLRWVGTPDPLGWDQAVPYRIHETYSYPPGAILSMIFPSPPQHVDPHMGAVCVALAMAGLAWGWKCREVQVMAVVGAAGFAIAMGGWSVFHGALYALVPGIEKARNPATAMFLVNFSFAVLAAIGLDAVRHSRRAVWALFLIALVGLAGLTFFKRPEIPSEVGITVVAALVAASLLHALGSGAVTRTQASVALVLLALAELSNSTIALLAPRSDGDRMSWNSAMGSNQDLVEYIRQQPGRLRVEIAGDVLPRNWPSFHQIESWGGYQPAVMRDPVGYDLGSMEPRLLNGVRYTIAKQPTQPDQTESYRGQSGLALYNNPRAFPRVWPVFGIIRSSGRAQTNEIIRTRLNDLWSAAISEDPAVPASPPCPHENNTEVVRHDASRVEIAARMGCDGIVVLSETWAPGWRAEIDGKYAPVHRVNGGMRGVPVPRGAHRVVLLYRPASVTLGAALTALGLVALVVVAKRW